MPEHLSTADPAGDFERDGIRDVGALRQLGTQVTGFIVGSRRSGNLSLQEATLAINEDWNSEILLQSPKPAIDFGLL